MVGYKLKPYKENGQDKFRVEFNFSSDREKTHISGSQGDHVTAHIAILSAFLEIANDETIKQIGDDVADFARNLLGKDCPEITLQSSYSDGIREKVKKILGSVDNLSEEESKFISDMAKSGYIPNSLKGKLKNLLSSTENISEQDTKDINRSLKGFKVTCDASYVTEFTSSILEEMQQQKTATFYSKGRIGEKKQSAGQEKQGPRALIMLNRLNKILEEQDQKKQQSKIISFIYSLTPLSQDAKDRGENQASRVIRYGLDCWFPTGKEEGNKSDRILNSLNNAKNDVDKLDILRNLKLDIDSNQDRLIEFMGELIDYERVLYFDSNRAISISDAKIIDFKSKILDVTGKDKKSITADNSGLSEEQIKRLEQKKLEYRETKLLENFSGCVVSNNQTDSGQSRLVVTRSNKDELLKVINRHILVLTSAFPRVDFESVLDYFIQDELMEKQGWKDADFTQSISQLKPQSTTTQSSSVSYPSATAIAAGAGTMVQSTNEDFSSSQSQSGSDSESGRSDGGDVVLSATTSDEEALMAKRKISLVSFNKLTELQQSLGDRREAKVAAREASEAERKNAEEQLEKYKEERINEAIVNAEGSDSFIQRSQRFARLELASKDSDNFNNLSDKSKEKFEERLRAVEYTGDEKAYQAEINKMLEKFDLANKLLNILEPQQKTYGKNNKKGNLTDRQIGRSERLEKIVYENYDDKQELKNKLEKFINKNLIGSDRNKKTLKDLLLGEITGIKSQIQITSNATTQGIMIQ